MTLLYETKLLSQMMTPEGMAEVIKAKVSPEVFEDPINRDAFEWMGKYWLDSERVPTWNMLEHEFPTVMRNLEHDVEESTDWLIEALNKRYALNGAQEILRKVNKEVNEDPVATIQEMADAARQLQELVGRIGDDGTPRLWDAAELRAAEQPRWLARNRLPRAAVSLLVGDEGIGKSLFWVYLVAAVTTGRPLLQFGVPKRDPGDVVVVVTEDDWSTTVLPRLMVAGADLSRVRVICTDDDGSGAPEFPRDLHLIDKADPVPALVVVDAWLDTVPARLDVKNPQQARQALHPWRETAVTTDAAVLLLTHTNRVASSQARDKYGATGELRKKARMTLYAQRDDDGNLVIGPDKANTAAAVMASRFSIQGVQHFPATEEHDGMVPRLVYVGDTDQTAQQHIAQAHATGHGSGTRDEVVTWLVTALANGPRWATDVVGAAQEAGFSVDQLKRQKRRAGVESVPDGQSKRWFWRLQGQEGIPGDEQGSAQ